jgi:mono/diheme cytochrome c family protein
MRLRWMLLLLAGIVAATGQNACAEWTELDDVECPPEGTDLTWNNFGSGFFADNCNSCHSVNAEDRRGAPVAFVFDTHDQVAALTDRIFLRSAADNVTMPPGPDDPGDEERWLLAEWLACGAPAGD